MPATSQHGGPMRVEAPMRRIGIVGAMIMAMAGSAAADEAIKELAPTGRLRVAIAVGPAASALWCVRDPASGKARGVPVELVEYAASGEIIAATGKNAWDVTFVPVDDERKKVVDFGAPYHLLQST